MKKIDFKKLLPHIIAIAVFLIASIMYTKPAMQGKVIAQHDVQQWKAMAQQSFEFREKYGYFPRWTNSMFGGMPAYMIALENKKDIGVNVFHFNSVMSLGLPKPVYYLFFACLGFYFLAITLGINSWLSMIGALVYGYCSYNPILIAAGHDTKLLSMCYSPAVLASMILIFDKRYYIGSASLVVMLSCLIAQGHTQIVYYTLLMSICLVVAFIARTIKTKEFRHLGLSLGISISLALLSFFACSNGLLPTYEYGKETMRGGQSMLTQADSSNKTKGGLDKDYAFAWSYGVGESLTLAVPNAYGGGSSTSLGDDPEVVKVLQETPSIPQEFANQVLQNTRAYWGEQPMPLEPVYIGGLICLLFLFGAILSKSRHKWWLIAITVLSLVLAWGKNFESINYFLFDHLPFYNKFRAPSMSLVMAQLSIPLLGIIFLQQLFYATSKEEIWKLTKKCLYITGGFVVLLLGFYFMADFKNTATTELRKSLSTAMQNQNEDFVRSYISALTKDRQALLLSDLLRSLGFIIAGAGLIFLYARNILKPLVVSIALIVLTAIDLMSVGRRFVNEDKFIEPTDYEGIYAMYNADTRIKQDPGFFRVMNLAFKDPQSGQFYADLSSSFNDALASYHHKTIGGYHPAKLSIYQDLISEQISKNIQAWGSNPMAPDSFPVLNMLNMKYVIVPDQTNPMQTQAVPNSFAMGNAWVVNEVKFVKNADEEMASLKSFNPKSIAFVDETYKSKVGTMPVPDSTAIVSLVENKNDEITYNFNAASPQFVVFSEVYYSGGWNAYVDGKLTDHVRTNYALRGMSVPAGKHTIVFKFEPKLVGLGETLAFWACLISVLVVLLCLFMEYKTSSKKLA